MQHFLPRRNTSTLITEEIMAAKDALLQKIIAPRQIKNHIMQKSWIRKQVQVRTNCLQMRRRKTTAMESLKENNLSTTTKQINRNQSKLVEFYLFQKPT